MPQRKGVNNFDLSEEIMRDRALVFGLSALVFGLWALVFGLSALAVG
jgi:hypothetical protein